MATHSSFLAWKIPTDSGVLESHSPWGHKESDMTECLSTISHCLYKSHFLYPFTHHIGCFHVLVVVNTVAINT